MLHSVYRSEFARARGLGVSFLLQVYDPVCRRSVGLSVIISQKNGKLRLHAPIGALFILCLFGFHKRYSATISDNIFHICTYICTSKYQAFRWIIREVDVTSIRHLWLTLSACKIHNVMYAQGVNYILCFFFQEFSKVCHLSLANTGLLLVV